MARNFMGNLGLKVLALVMALAVYGHVFSAREQEMVFRVPLVLGQLPPELAFTNPPPQEAKVRVRGYGKDLIKLRARSFHAEVSLESPREGVFQRPILGSDVRFPKGMEALAVEVIEPHMIELRVEESDQRSLPVQAVLQGELPRSRALASTPRVDPPRILVFGPRSVLRELEAVPSTPVSMENLHGDYTREVALDLPPGVTSEYGRVRLTLEVEERLTRRSPPLSIQVNAPLGVRIAEVRPDSAVLAISGAVSVVGQLDLSNVRLTAELPQRAREPVRLAIRPAISALPHPAPISMSCEPESCWVVPR